MGFLGTCASCKVYLRTQLILSCTQEVLKIILGVMALTSRAIGLKNCHVFPLAVC